MNAIVFQLFIAYSIVACSVMVFFRRLFRGPRQASWSLPFEVAVEVTKRFTHNGFDEAMAGKSPSEAPTPRDPFTASKVALTHETLHGMQTEVHTPRTWKHGDPTLLYWHGGGYISCSPRTHRAMVSSIALHSGARCIVPNYPKAPQHPYPAALHKAVECFEGLVASGVAPSTLYVGGDSAGGGLTLAMTLRLRDAGSPLPTALVLLSPWVELTGSGESVHSAQDDILNATMITNAAKLYAAQTPLHDPLLSPLHANLAGLPPMLVQTGGAEVFHSENHRFVETARTAGVTVQHEVFPAMTHVFQTLATFHGQGRKAIRAIGAFIRGQNAT